MIPEDLIYGVQSEVTVLLTINNVTYIDRDIVGGGEVVGGAEIKDRIISGLVFEQSVAPFAGSVSQSTLGSVRLANTELSPLTAEMASSLRGQDYTIQVCGVINKGLGNEEFISYDNRLTWLTGKVNGARWSKDSFLVSLGSSDSVLDQDFLDVVIKDSDEVIDGDFDFSSPNTTSAVSTGVIDININRAANNRLIVTPSVALTELDLSINPVSAPALTSFVFTEVSNTLVQTNNGVSISLSSTTTTVFTMTLTFPEASKMSWIFRDIDVETISNWSIAPDNTPDYGDNKNAELHWSNLNGVNQITFDVTGIPGTKTILVPFYDPLTRPHVFGSNNSMKFWPLRIEPQLAPPTGITFSTAPTSSSLASGAFGYYGWESAGLSVLNIDADYSSATVEITSSDNKVQIKGTNSQAGIELAFSRARKDSATDPDKVGVRPVAFGKKVSNITPLELSAGRYDIGATAAATFPVQELRNDTQVVNQVPSQIQFLDNQANNILSWYDDNVADSIIEVSGTPTIITVDIATNEKTLLDAINFICDKAGLTLTSLEPELANLTVSCWFDSQLTVSEVLSEILTPLDAIFYIDGGLVVEKRKTELDEFDIELSSDVVSKIDVQLEEVGLHRLVVNHSRNWTIQQPPYSSEYVSVERGDDAIKYIDYPANTKRSGSTEITLNTYLDGGASASAVLAVFNREKLRKHRAQFYVKAIAGRIKPNYKIKVDDPVLPNGFFLSDRVMFDQSRNEQFVRGVWYAE